MENTYDELCQRIFDVNPGIRFAGILGRNGDLVAGGNKQDIPSLLLPQEAKMSLHYAAKRWETRRNLSHRIGNVKYSFTEYEKIKQISIPLNHTELLLISMETKLDFDEVLPVVLGIIKK
jgi:hypothetical protein